jgi:hypothetical protein
MEKDATTIGLTKENHKMLKKFDEENIFNEMKDGYRFAIAYSLSKGIIPDKVSGGKTTIFNVGSIDENQEISSAILALSPQIDVPVFIYAERLAEAGMTELVKIYKLNNRLNLSEIIEENS